MKLSLVSFVLTLFIAAVPAASQGSEGPPKLLHAHPDRDSDGPYWVAASYAFRPDGTVRSEERIGALASNLPGWLKMPFLRAAPENEALAPAELGCKFSPSLYALSPQTVFPPGDFRGWVAASDAVVLGTVAGFVPGFDQEGWANTLVLLEDIEHLYPSRKYPYFVKYAILPYARFVAGGRVFCQPRDIPQEYYPEVGDRLLIAADLPADRDGEALTVMSMSRVVQVEDDGGLKTYGRSDFYPVAFATDFPQTLDDAKKRAWDVWRDGFVDLADTLEHEEFTRLWRGLKSSAAEAVRSGCFVVGVLPNSNGWTLSTSCPPPEEEDAAAEDPAS